MTSKKIYGNYRSSHMGRGSDYHDSFQNIPHRKMMYDKEMSIVKKILSSKYNNKDVSYMDFACGTGRVLSAISPLSTKSTGVEISESMLSVAKKNSPKAVFLHGDITRELKLPVKEYDLITSFRFFPNAEPELRAEVFQALSKSSKDHGLLVFNNHVNKSSLIFRVLRLFNKPYGNEGVDSKQLLLAAEKEGYILIQTYHIGVLPFLDNINIFPISIISIMESIFSRVPVLRSLASDIIYVFEKKA